MLDISTQQKDLLASRGLNLVKKQRKNMSQLILKEQDRLFLIKCPKIENFFREFKHFLVNGLSLARSIAGAFSEILTSPAAIFLKPTMPI